MSKKCKQLKKRDRSNKNVCGTKNVTEVTKNVTEVALWPFMAKYRSDWTGIVLSRGHRSKFIWSCFFNWQYTG